MNSISTSLVIGVMLAAAVMPVGVYGQIANSDFETGSYSGWTVISGTAWGSGPADQRGHPHIEAWEGRYYANSYLGGESAVGVLRSDSFTLRMPIAFLMSGHNHIPGQQDPEHHNYVTLNRVSDGAELDRVWAPGHGYLYSYVLSSPETVGEDVYIEVVDNGSDNGYAWLAVDFFMQGTYRPNGDFETGTFDDWNAISGTAWGSAPVTTNGNPHVSEWQGDLFADTYHGGEAAVGVLRSESFALQGPIQFRIAGHDHWPGVEDPHDHNYVTLNLASNGTELDRVWAPGLDAQPLNAFEARALSSPDHVGEEVYIEVVDDGDGAGYAWIAVDAFDITSSPFSHVNRSDTWVATDALGRSLPTYSDVGPPRDDRFVGIFYFTWHGEHGTEGPFNVHELEQGIPECSEPGLYDLPVCLDELEFVYGPFGQGHHWGEPLFDYYVASDDYVVGKHMQMLADAGVDTLIVDNTNNFSYTGNVLRLMSICQRIRNNGGRTPQITFLARETIVDNEALSAAYNAIYKPGLFPDLWFRWQGKPLLLVFDANDPPSLEFSDKILNFFTIRESWAFSDWAWFGDGHHKWPWIDTYPQGYGWDEDSGVAEAMAVSIGQHANGNIGRSYSNGSQPPFGSTPTEQGLRVIEQWSQALSIDPEFVFFTGWNEWVAGRYERTEETGPISLLGDPREIGESYFVDAFDHEFSRDAEPVKGGHGDNYYYQMIDFIRQFKGAAEPPTPSPAKTISIDGVFDDWDDVAPDYRDPIGDLPRRNEHPGYMSAGPYTNLTGRNDIIGAKVTYDVSNLYFHVRTLDPISPYSNPDWMVLYLDIDSNAATGWEGYDFVVNRTGVGPTETTLEANVGDAWNWSSVAAIQYQAGDNELELAVPRELLGETVLPIEFDLKWADNTQPAGDILSFTTDGDAAPNDRFNYRYRNADSPVPGDFDDDGDVDLDDYTVFADCLAGPGATPAPTDPQVTVQECLDVFDSDRDDDVDLADFASFQEYFTG